MGLDFRILGALEVLEDGVPKRLDTPKLRLLLLRLLISADAEVSADALIDALWTDDPPVSAGKLIQVYVSQLRKVIGSAALVSTPRGYALEVGPDQIDASRFARLFSEGQQALSGNPRLASSILRRALGLWRGPALAEVAHMPFAAAEVGRLEELRAACIEARFTADLAADRTTGLIAEIAAAVADHPLREPLRALHMRSLVRANRAVDALDVYRETRALLRRELGIEPGPLLREAQQLALQVSPAAPPVAHAQAAVPLPEPPTKFVGRSRELAELEALLSGDEVRLVNLTGAGGSGKTRLAIALAGRLGEQYADGVALVELASVRHPDLVLSTLVEVLGVPRVPEVELIETLTSWLAEREILIVIDNAEHLVDAFASLAHLVARAPRLTLLVTSRRVMHVRGEHVYPVLPLNAQEAEELFLQCAHSADGSFSAERADIAAICERLDRLPLAIEMAAARVGTLEPKTLLSRLRVSLSALGTGPRDLPARQQTLLETLRWSVNLLEPGQQAALAALSAFPGGCTVDAAECVGADLEGLTALVEHSLLRRNDLSLAPRFVMLETVREFGASLLGPTRHRVETALVDFCVELVERAELRGPNQNYWLVELDAERANIRAALDVADGDCQLRIVNRMWRYWWIRGHVVEGRALIDNALAARSTRRDLRPAALNAAAGLAWAAGDLEVAHARASQALKESRECGAVWDEMSAHTRIGLAAQAGRDFPAALRHHESALAISELNQWDGDVLIAKLNIGRALICMGEPSSARTPLNDVLTAHRSSDNVEGIAFATLALGLAAFALRDEAAMEAAFAESAEAFGAIGFEGNKALALIGMAVSAVARADAASAANLLGEAAEMLTRSGQKRDEDFTELADQAESAARAALGPQQFQVMYERGRSAGSSQ